MSKLFERALVYEIIKNLLKDAIKNKITVEQVPEFVIVHIPELIDMTGEDPMKRVEESEDEREFEESELPDDEEYDDDIKEIGDVE